MNWFHISSLNQTVNLGLVTRIEWDYLEREQFRTRLFFLEGEYNLDGDPQSSYVDIFSKNDRLFFRKFFTEDNWEPKLTT